MAKPILSTRVGDIPAILGDTGYLADPDSPAQLAAQLRHILHHPEEARQKGQQARDRCVALYSVDRMAIALREVLENLQ